MELQNNILEHYKRQYPNDTVRMVAAKTGIQVTRVFRLFNGHEMKLSEFEAFQKLTYLNHPNLIQAFFDTSHRSVKKLPSEVLTKIIHKMQDCLDRHELENNATIDFMQDYAAK